MRRIHRDRAFAAQRAISMSGKNVKEAEEEALRRNLFGAAQQISRGYFGESDVLEGRSNAL